MLYAVKIYDRVERDASNVSWISGNASEMTVISRLTMNPAVAVMSNVNHDRRSIGVGSGPAAGSVMAEHYARRLSHATFARSTGRSGSKPTPRPR